jgi:hypothetical protein
MGPLVSGSEQDTEPSERLRVVVSGSDRTRREMSNLGRDTDGDMKRERR